ncbi:MAG: tRNA lysidine(34) synthetase TilS [Gaiellales bacterium]
MPSLKDTVAAEIAAHELIEPGGSVTCLVSGGADSTCLWHVLGALGYAVSAVHVNHGVRGPAADRDADHCLEVMGAEIVHIGPAATEAELRERRYAATAGRGLRATGHTASDQVETVLMRLLASGSPRGIRPRRDDGVVRPLLRVWREETAAYCSEHGLRYVEDETNPDTLRGRMRATLLPLLDELEPRSRASLLALGDERPRLPRRLEEALVELLQSVHGSASRDLGGGVRAVRAYDELELVGSVEWGPWRLSSEAEGLVVRGRRAGDRLAGRRKKVQDLLVDAKIPRGERDSWPIVARRSGEVVCVPGVAEAPGWEGVVSIAENDSR